MTAALDDLWHGGPNGSPDAEQIDFDHPLPLRSADRQGAADLRCDAGIGDGHVEAAELPDRAGHCGLDLFAIADVGGDRDRPPPDSPRRHLGFGGVEVDDGDRGTPDLQLARGLEADPPRRPGDQGDPSVEVVGRHRG